MEFLAIAFNMILWGAVAMAFAIKSDRSKDESRTDQSSTS